MAGVGATLATGAIIQLVLSLIDNPATALPPQDRQPLGPGCHYSATVTPASTIEGTSNASHCATIGNMGAHLKWHSNGMTDWFDAWRNGS